MSEVKVLHFLNSLNNGGVENFLLNTFNNMDLRKIENNIMVRDSVNPLKKKFDELNIETIESPNFLKKPFKHYKFVRRFLEKTDEKYDYIHIHANSLVYLLPVLLDLKNSKVIVHSHSTNASNNIAKQIHYYNKHYILNKKAVDIKIACSMSAGKWMFGQDDFEILYSGIMVEQYTFQQELRKSTREELNINDKDLVLGHVGGFNNAKNHNFIIDIFNEIIKKESNAKLILVGDGKLRTKIEQKIKDLNLQENVLLLGVQNSVQKYLNAMDIFLFPSLYEGLGMSLIEAQTSGLKCYTSKDVVPEEIDATGNVKFIPLSKSPRYWAESILLKKKYSRSDQSKAIRNAGFDIKDSARKLEAIYLDYKND